ncbi:hypothetical protein ACLMJK_007493 [Lecanora helva]
MSGRGVGGGLVRDHKPKDIKVTLNLRTTVSSSTIPLPDASSDPSILPDIFIQIHCSIKHSKQPNLPVTLSTWRTPLERQLSGKSSSSPAWAASALTYLRSTSDEGRYGGPPQLGWRVCRRGGYARDLREDWDFITIPSLESGEEILVAHRLPVDELQFSKNRDDGYRDEVKPEKGEKWTICPSRGGLGTFWWAWGSLSGDLKEKEFRNDEWFEGDKEGGDRDQEGKEWVYTQGDNGSGLTMEIENLAEVEFV